MTTSRAVAAFAPLVLAGCALGGRLTGGVLAGPGDRGTTGYVTATLELGMMDRGGAIAVAELGGTSSDRRPATHVGLRYRAAGEPAAWTASAAVETSRDGTFGQATAGLSLIQPTTTHETPDVIEGHILGADIEGVVMLGGRGADDIAPAVGAQLSLSVLFAALMR